MNPRRLHQPGERVVDKVWVWDEERKQALQEVAAEAVSKLDKSGLNGTWQQVVRTATVGQFCGIRSLLYINERPEDGERKWGFEKVP